MPRPYPVSGIVFGAPCNDLLDSGRCCDFKPRESASQKCGVLYGTLSYLPSHSLRFRYALDPYQCFGLLRHLLTCTTSSSIHGIGSAHCSFWVLSMAPWLSRATNFLRIHPITKLFLASPHHSYTTPWIHYILIIYSFTPLTVFTRPKHHLHTSYPCFHSSLIHIFTLSFLPFCPGFGIGLGLVFIGFFTSCCTGF